MTNDGSGVNEWACGNCGNHIGAGTPLVRVSYALDFAGAAQILREPELLIGEEYCTPECAINGTMTMLRRLKEDQAVKALFGEGQRE